MKQEDKLALKVAEDLAKIVVLQELKDWLEQKGEDKESVFSERLYLAKVSIQINEMQDKLRSSV